MHPSYLQYFLLLFLTHIVCLRHLSDVRPYVSSSVFSFSVPFVAVLLLSISRMVPSILLGGQPTRLVSRYFFVLLRYPFIVFSFLFACMMVSASNIYKYLLFFFSLSVQVISWFDSSIHFNICLFPIFIRSITDFSTSNSIPIFWLYIFILCFLPNPSAQAIYDTRSIFF